MTVVGQLAGHLVGHQGGWDEILFVGAPLVVFGGLLYLANRRANDQAEDRNQGNQSKDRGQNADDRSGR